MTQHVMNAIEQVGAGGPAAELLASLPAADHSTFCTDLTECVECGGALSMEDLVQEGSLGLLNSGALGAVPGWRSAFLP